MLTQDRRRAISVAARPRRSKHAKPGARARELSGCGIDGKIGGSLRYGSMERLRSTSADADASPQAEYGRPGGSTRSQRLARAARGDAAVAPSADAAVAAAPTSGGQALPAGLAARFGSSLSADLSAVRVHAGPSSAAAADSLGARAFAFGDDIHFAEGQYRPDASDGQRLLAHEVAHTVQQAGAPARTQTKLEVTTPGDATEVEADSAADAMMSGAFFAIAPSRATAARVARWVDPGAAAEVIAAIDGADQPHVRQIIDALEAAMIAHSPGVELAGRSLAVAPADLPGLVQRARQRFEATVHPPGTFDEARFAIVFSRGMSVFQRLRGTRTLQSLFTPAERDAVQTFLRDRRLPPVGTFATFFSTADESLRLVFSACLHVADDTLSERTAATTDARGQRRVVHQRAIRANDCGDWVGRVVTYARNEDYVSRTARRRGGLCSPDGLNRYTHGNGTIEATEEGGHRTHSAVPRSIIERMLPGDWVMIHWHPGTRLGDDNHSMMFIDWVDAAWGRDGYRKARFANQSDNNVGGGSFTEVRVCTDATLPRYIYNVTSSRRWNQAEHPGAEPAAGTAATPAAAPAAAPVATGTPAAAAATDAGTPAAADATTDEPDAAAPTDEPDAAVPAALEPFVASHR